MRKQILIFTLFTLLFFAYKKGVFAATYTNVASGSVSSSTNVTNPNNAVGNSADSNYAVTSANGTAWSISVNNFNVSGINPNEVVSAVYFRVYGTLDQAANATWGFNVSDDHNINCGVVSWSTSPVLGASPHLLFTGGTAYGVI